MGVVYKARSAEGREVAVKVLLAAADAEAVAFFEREKRLLWALGQNDGFVPVLDAGTQSDKPYLVMPLVSGGTLRARLKKGPGFTIDEAVALFARLARALG